MSKSNVGMQSVADVALTDTVESQHEYSGKNELKTSRLHNDTRHKNNDECYVYIVESLSRIDTLNVRLQGGGTHNHVPEVEGLRRRAKDRQELDLYRGSDQANAGGQERKGEA